MDHLDQHGTPQKVEARYSPTSAFRRMNVEQELGDRSR
jgi:hypothetical protein